MALRRCPICKELAIDRRGVKTCGGPDCMSEWKRLDSHQRMRFIRDANKPLIDLLSLRPQGEFINEDDDNKEWEAEKRAEKQASVTMPSTLANILGVAKLEDEVCKEHGKVMCFICSGVLKAKED